MAPRPPIRLRYDGHSVTVHEANLVGPPQSFSATSGMPDYQRPEHQDRKGEGPIPQGTYKLKLQTDPSPARVRSDGSLAPSSLIQTLPDGRPEWGKNRVRLEPHDQAATSSGRSGFYLHDSTKGYTEGCIEVDSGIFDVLRNFAQRFPGQTVLLDVNHIYPDTYGGTRR